MPPLDANNAESTNSSAAVTPSPAEAASSIAAPSTVSSAAGLASARARTPQTCAWMSAASSVATPSSSGSFPYLLGGTYGTARCPPARARLDERRGCVELGKPRIGFSCLRGFVRASGASGHPARVRLNMRRSQLKRRCVCRNRLVVRQIPLVPSPGANSSPAHARLDGSRSPSFPLAQGRLLPEGERLRHLRAQAQSSAVRLD
mmetsp:Transcript_17333/g.43141  ORF Transcript_17333/g.43141 Transcript_17333/m.43141 type:complete len:204 (-) Transcript_17333:203-814(-)